MWGCRCEMWKYIWLLGIISENVHFLIIYTHKLTDVVLMLLRSHPANMFLINQMLKLNIAIIAQTVNHNGVLFYFTASAKTRDEKHFLQVVCITHNLLIDTPVWAKCHSNRSSALIACVRAKSRPFYFILYLWRSWWWRKLLWWWWG